MEIVRGQRVFVLMTWVEGMRKFESGQIMKKASKVPTAPPAFLEYSYYAILFYAMFGAAWGVSIPMAGAGLLAGLSILCVLHFGNSVRLINVCKPIAFALGCAMSILLLQLVLHGESFGNEALRSFVTWGLALIVLQALSSRRGFLHRFAIAAFLVGCAMLPYLKIYTDTDEVIRVGVGEGVALSNPNSLGMWFGFCAVYFVVAGLETKKNIVRVAYWLMGALSLYVVAITVSRGPLLGVAIASVFAFQTVLKRSFVPILMLFLFGWIIFVSGIFDVLVGYYTVRGDEETGRTYLWTKGTSRFLDAWLVGEGLSNAWMRFPSGTTVTAHNGLIWIAQSSGFLPLVFFVRYLVGAARGAFRARTKRTPDAPFLLPLFIFAFLEMMILSEAFMSPWHIVVFSAAMAPGYVPRAYRITTGKTITGSKQHGKGPYIPQKNHLHPC